MRATKIEVAIVLAAACAAHSAEATDLLWTTVPGQSGSSLTKSILQAPPAPIDLEVADDFQVSGTIERLLAKGSNCSIGCTPPPFQGVWVRFYEWTATGPGALQSEQFIPAGHPGLTLLPPANPATFDIMLPAPFVASGWHFMSVQAAFAQGFAYWAFKRANPGSPMNAQAYLKDDLGGGQWQLDHFFGTPIDADASFELWGVPGAAAPVLEGISEPACTRSARLLVSGAFFGGAQGDGQLLIDGLEAILTEWSTNLIIGYVPEQAALGEVEVRVVTAAGSSAPLPLTVLAREQVGRVRWRFAVDADLMGHRPGVAADGTVYVNDSEGRLSALSPDGGLRWITDTLQGQPGHGAEGPVAVSPGGTAWVTANPLGPAVQIVAIDPDGGVIWTFTDPDALSLASGPALGPDGNIYAVFHDLDFDSFGAVSLTPEGDLRWSHNGSPPLYEHGALGSEIVFSASTAGGPIDQMVVTVDREYDRRLYAFALEDGEQRFAVTAGLTESIFLQPQLQPAARGDGSVLMSEFLANGPGWGLQAFDPGDGGRQWRWDPGTVNELSAPAVGPDGRIYVTWNLQRVSALAPAGAPLWQYVDDGLLRTAPASSPANDVIVVGSGPGLGLPGSITALDAVTGAKLWEEDLPHENGDVVPSVPALFTADGATAYVPTSILNDSEQNRYCYLYALDTSGGAGPGDLDGDGVVGFADLSALLGAWGPCPASCPPSCPADLDGSCHVGFGDLSVLLANWG